MDVQHIDRQRGVRLRQAMTMRGHRKASALAMELDISAAAMTKWLQGHSMSVGHACSLATALDISLDWLLMGRNGPDWLHPDRLRKVEIDLIGMLRERPGRIIHPMLRLIGEIPKSATVEQSPGLDHT